MGSFFTKDGTPPPKGSAKSEEWGEVTKAAQEKETEALDKTRIPKDLKHYVRDYFDSLTPERK